MKKLKQLIFSLFYKEFVTLKTGDDLTGKVIVLTGARKGIGHAIATVLLAEGASVVLVGRDIDGLKKEFKNKSEKTLFIKGDVTQESDCKKIVAETVKKYNKIDVLINNVGNFFGSTVETIDEKKWDAMMEVNVKGMFLMSKHTVPVMKKNESGLIVNMGSKVSHNTNVSPHMTVYAAAKYAVEGFSLALEKELQPFNIRVSCIMPATVNTVMSLNAKNQLSTYRIGQVISLLIKLDTVTFQSIILKSKNQEI